MDKREKQKELAKEREFACKWQKKFVEKGKQATTLAKAALQDAESTRWQDATKSTKDYMDTLDIRIQTTMDLGYSPKYPKDAPAEELDGMWGKWMAASTILDENIEDMKRAMAQFRDIVKKVSST